ncbi:MAG: NAD-binding protein [Gemmatimonadota bacterium]
MREFLQRARYGWLYLAAFVLVWASGVIGFLQHYATPGGHYDIEGGWLDAAYDSFKLFTLGYGGGPIGRFANNPLLHVARIAAPIVFALGALLALAAIFRDRFRRFRVKHFWRDHVVVCGLGEKGFRLVKEFRRAGTPVAVIEQNPADPLLEPVRETGAAVIVGDARRPDSLRLAGVRRASNVIAVCGEDGVNAEIALQASQEAEGRHARPLNCVSHVTDPHLCRLLKEREWEAGRGGGFRLEFFNIYSDGAAALLREHPPFDESAPGPASPPRILVVGFGQLSQSLVRDLARRWARRRDGAGPLRLTIADQDLERRWREFLQRFPYVESACEVELRELEREVVASSPSLIARELGSPPPDVVYVSLENDSASVSAALAFRSAFPGARFPIVCVLEADVGLADLIDRVERGEFRNLHAFPLAKRTCTCEIVLQNEIEILARANHEHYRAHRERSAAGRPADASLRPWAELPESLKESNRQFVDHLTEKLRTIGYRIVPLEDWFAEPIPLAPDEIELLARFEHERFIRERSRDGWRQGPKKDIARKLHPDLVPWEELSEEIREYDRNLVRKIPDLLQSVDRTLRRVEG